MIGRWKEVNVAGWALQTSNSDGTSFTQDLWYCRKKQSANANRPSVIDLTHSVNKWQKKIFNI